MPSWIRPFNDVPWKNARSLAPALVESGKKLWDRVANRDSRIGTPAAEVKSHSLEERITQLEEEAVSSFDVVRSIAQQHSQLTEQHSQLVQAADLLLVRTRVLLLACALLGLAFIAFFVVVVGR